MGTPTFSKDLSSILPPIVIKCSMGRDLFHFRWLQLRQPAAMVGYTFFVYDLTNDRKDFEKLKETFAKAGHNASTTMW